MLNLLNLVVLEGEGMLLASRSSRMLLCYAFSILGMTSIEAVVELLVNVLVMKVMMLVCGFGVAVVKWVKVLVRLLKWCGLDVLVWNCLF